MFHIAQGSIILDMKASTREAALRELAALVAVRCGRFTEEILYKTLLEREALGSTGIGNGVALPHGMVAGLDEILLCFGRSRTGVPFDAIDGGLVYFFIVLLAPAGQPQSYLRSLAGLSVLARDHNFRHHLQYSAEAEDIIALFTGADTAAA